MTPRKRTISKSTSDSDSDSRRHQISLERERELAEIKRKWREQQKREHHYEKRRERAIAEWNRRKKEETKIKMKKEDQFRRNQTSHGERRRSDSSEAGPSSRVAPLPRSSRSPARNILTQQGQSTQVPINSEVMLKILNLRRKREETAKTKNLIDFMGKILEEHLELLQRDVEREPNPASPHGREQQQSTSGYSRRLAIESPRRRGYDRSRSRSRERNPRRDDRHGRRSRSRSRHYYQESNVSSSRHQKEESSSRHSPDRRSSSRDYNGQPHGSYRQRNIHEQDYRRRRDERPTTSGPQQRSIDYPSSGAPRRSLHVSGGPYQETRPISRSDEFSGPYPPPTYPPIQPPVMHPPTPCYPHGSYTMPEFRVPDYWLTRPHLPPQLTYPPHVAFPPWVGPRAPPPPNFFINGPNRNQPYRTNRFRVYRSNTTQETRQRSAETRTRTSESIRNTQERVEQSDEAAAAAAATESEETNKK